MIVNISTGAYRGPHATKQPDGTWGPPYYTRLFGGHALVNGCGVTVYRGSKVSINLPFRLGLALEHQERAESLGGGHFPLRVSIGALGRSWQWEGHKPRHWGAEVFPGMTSQADIRSAIVWTGITDSVEQWLNQLPKDHWLNAIEWPGDSGDMFPYLTEQVGWSLEAGAPIYEPTLNDYLVKVYGITEAEWLTEKEEDQR